MSDLVEFARKELEMGGWLDKEGIYDGMIGEAVLELIALFSRQGHSGASAEICTVLFNKLSRFEALSPLTGEDNEWIEIDGTREYQNRRCSHVFKDETGVYDSRGKLFRYKNGMVVQRRESRVSISFPYTPKTEIVELEEEE